MSGERIASGRRRRRRRALRWTVAVLGVAVAAVLTTGAVWAARQTLEPHPDEPEHVDALLVLYSQPAVYDAALELLGRGVADRAFVSAHLGPDGHEKLCGEPARTDPRLAGVTVECFDPDPVTTQGEVAYAARRMGELGLTDLGVLTFGEHLERARLLAQRCWAPGVGDAPADSTVAMYQFDSGYDDAMRARQAAYGVLAFGKAALTPGCEQELPGVVRWPLDLVKRALGMPVDAALPSGAADSAPREAAAAAPRGGTR